MTVVLAVTWVARKASATRWPTCCGDDPLSRAEPGCLQYDVHATRRPEPLLLFERYVDEAALEAHSTSPHFHELVLEGPCRDSRRGSARR